MFQFRDRNITRNFRYDDDMARLENEFRDSHLMRIPNGNMNEKVYRHEEVILLYVDV